MKPLANWNENCKNVATKARNAMHNNKTLENNCIYYRRLKGMHKAQHVIKSTARKYWQDFCRTLLFGAWLRKSTVLIMSTRSV